jgi:D-alanyl-D-alanine carboxypeptidase/D-alanyl-D-alanine-endopeptidase (penicillin-binding protein 4)
MRYINTSILLLLLPLLLFLFSFPLLATLAEEPELTPLISVKHLIDRGGYAVQKDGYIIAAHNLHKTFVPASVIKIATGLAALRILGPDYRFETHFYRDSDQNIYIKGYGDPFLISEQVVEIVRKLKSMGCEKINNIYIDDTTFAIGGPPEGSGSSENPYDAQNSGLAVNFNTINIEKDRAGKIWSAEEQTPTLGLMEELAADMAPGTHRINVSRHAEEGNEIIRRYTGELFRAFQKQEKIAGEGEISFRTVPVDLAPFYIHRSSKTLEDIIAPLMLYSNNFIANQLFLALGSVQYGYPASWEKSMQAMADFLQKEFNLSANEIEIIEGSGLSRKNRVSPHSMLLLLNAFKPYSHLLSAEAYGYMKSGTLKGVYAYAGYFTANGKLDSFVLLLNQEKNNRDRILMLLEDIYLNWDLEEWQKKESGTSAD